MENQDNRNREEELDTASEAKAGEADDAVEIPVEDGNLEEETKAAEEENGGSASENDNEAAQEDDAEDSGSAMVGFFRK